MLEQLPSKINIRIRPDNDDIAFVVIDNCSSAADKAYNGSDAETII